MLKNSKLVVPAALVMCVLSGLMLALGTRPMMEPAKVAVVDLEKVFSGLAEKVVKEGDFEKKRAEAQTRVSDMEAKIKKLTDEITIMPEGTEREAKVFERIRMIINTKNEKDLGEDMLAREGGKMLREIYNKIDTAAEEIAKKRGLNMVLVNDENMPIREPSNEEVNKVLRMKKILYVDPSLDITADVITHMNNNFKANVSGATSTPTTPAPAPAGANAKKGP